MNGTQEKQMSEDAQSAKAIIGIETKKKRVKIYKKMDKSKVTQEFLKKTYIYNPLTGEWRWKRKYISRNRLSKKYNTLVGSINNVTGYRYFNIKNRSYLSSRLAFLYMEGYLPEYQIDHINRIRHDDRWSNLRHVTPSCNNRNVGIRRVNTSGVTGVCYHKTQKKWVSIIHDSGNRTFKSFELFDDAVMERWRLEKKYKYPKCNTTSDAYQYLLQKGLI